MVGHVDRQTSKTQHDTLARVISQWIGLHVYVQAVIWSYDATWFQPGGPAGKLPNGTWGKWCDTAGAQTRSNVARYWEPQEHAPNFPAGGGGY